MLTLDDFFSSFRSRLEAHRERQATDLSEAPSFNVYRYLRPNENLLSDIIADLLNPTGAHGQGPVFLRQVLRLVVPTMSVPDAVLERRPAPLDPLLPVPLEVRPTQLSPLYRPHVVHTPSIAHQNALQLLIGRLRAGRFDA